MRQVEEAGEQARLFNARELLFEREVTVPTRRLELWEDGVNGVVPAQDYQQLSNIKKRFEPYFQLWDTSQQWLSASAAWHAQSFLTLDAEQIETDVNTCVEIKFTARSC
jgi:dynein heavy chain